MNVFGVIMKIKKQNNQSIFHYLIFDWQLKMERRNDTLISKHSELSFNLCFELKTI